MDYYRGVVLIAIVLITTITATCSLQRTNSLDLRTKSNKIIIKGDNSNVNVHVMSNDSIIIDTIFVDTVSINGNNRWINDTMHVVTFLGDTLYLKIRSHGNL